MKIVYENISFSRQMFSHLLCIEQGDIIFWPYVKTKIWTFMPLLFSQLSRNSSMFYLVRLNAVDKNR